MDILNYYFLLNVNETATKEEIIKSYRNLSRLAKTNNIIKYYLPQIKLAYIVLTNPVSKKEYDLQLKNIDNNIELNSLECEDYAVYENDNIEDEKLNQINKLIHNENNTEKIKVLRDQEQLLFIKCGAFDK